MAEEVEMCVEIASKIDNTWIEKADINLLCRACATETNENMIPIFEGTGLELDLQAKIDKHLPVKITKDDGLPNKMCVQCASTLVAWHDIYTGCTDAETKLKNLLNKSKDDTHAGEKVASSSVEREDPVMEKPKSQQKVAGEMEVDDNDSDYIYEGDEDDDDYVQDDDDNDEDEDGDEEQETEEVVIEKLDSKEKGKTVEITDKGTIIRDQVLVLDIGEKKAISLNLHRKENIVTLKLLSGFRDSSCFNGTFIEEFVEYVRKYHGLGDIDIEIEFESIEDDKMFNSLRCDNDNSKSHICHTLATEINKETSTAFGQAVDVSPYCNNSNLMISQDHETHMNTYEFFNKTFNLSIGKSINSALSYSFSSSVLDEKDISSSAGQSSSDVRLNLHCNLCNKYFANKGSLTAHNRIHSDKRYLCDVCGKKFSMNSALKSHKHTHSDSRPYECQICHEKFKLKRYLRIHQLWVHKMDPKEVAKNVNSISSYSFSSSVLDKKDISSSSGQSSSDVRSNFNCNLCNKYFASKGSLTAHKVIHSDKKYVCDVCGKKFSMNPDLRRHKHTHSDSKPYGCEICHEKFTQKRYLREHQVRRHKMDPKEVAEKVYGPKRQNAIKDDKQQTKPHSCEECNANFKYPCQLSKHIKNSHSNERPFECQVCNATFKLSDHLQKHSFVHGEKKHVCKTCGKKFSVRGDFKRHILIHTDLKPYLCHFCPKAFAVESYLKIHINRKHRIQATEAENK